jgi:hypothetical protein
MEKLGKNMHARSICRFLTDRIFLDHPIFSGKKSNDHCYCAWRRYLKQQARGSACRPVQHLDEVDGSSIQQQMAEDSGWQKVILMTGEDELTPKFFYML